MNNSLKRLLLTLMCGLTITLASAQGTAEETAKSKAAQTTSELKASLNLTHEQQLSVTEVMTYVEMKKATSKDKSVLQNYMTQEMNKILSESQMQVWLDMEATKNPQLSPEAEKERQINEYKEKNQHQE